MERLLQFQRDALEMKVTLDRPTNEDSQWPLRWPRPWSTLLMSPPIMLLDPRARSRLKSVRRTFRAKAIDALNGAAAAPMPGLAVLRYSKREPVFVVTSHRCALGALLWISQSDSIYGPAGQCRKGRQ